VEPLSTRVWDEPVEPQQRGLSANAPRALRAVGDDEDWASASDRQMMEATAAAVGLVSAKWKVELMYLLAARVSRHSRLRDHLLVSKKVLSEALKSLERDGLVSRRVFAEIPVRVEYSLTPLGRSFTGPLFALYEWTEEHFEEVIAARDEHDKQRARVTRGRDDPPRFTAAFQVGRR
jgi:DNA-binding HxlR family transcriptional regulator